MGCEAIKVPILDFSNPELKPGTPAWNSVKDQVLHAMQEYGYFEAKFEKISKELRKAIFDPMVEFFNLPPERKLNFSNFNDSIGYLGSNLSSLIPLTEGMRFGDATDAENVERIIRNIWPQGNSYYSNTIQSYVQKLIELEQIIRRMLLECLGIEKHMDEDMQSREYAVFWFSYRAPHSEENTPMLKSHKDENTLTILAENQVHGLQVLTEGGKWIDVKPSPDSFIVMLGETFGAWSNGRLHAARHRVAMAGNKDRLSIGLFSSPKPDTIIKAPEELMDEEHPMVFNPFKYGDYVEYRNVNVDEEYVDLTSFFSA